MDRGQGLGSGVGGGSKRTNFKRSTRGHNLPPCGQTDR